MEAFLGYILIHGKNTTIVKIKSSISTRHDVANNKYLPDYDSQQPTSFITCLFVWCSAHDDCCCEGVSEQFLNDTSAVRWLLKVITGIMMEVKYYVVVTVLQASWSALMKKTPQSYKNIRMKTVTTMYL